MPIAKWEGFNGLAQDSRGAGGVPAELWLNVNKPLAEAVYPTLTTLLPLKLFP